LAGIYLGTIKKWNDKALVADNPGVKLPNDDIMVVHRTDASGTTFIFTDYLSKVSPEWKSKVGAAKAVSWPTVPLGGNQSAGVTGLVKQTPDSIGYVELIYAIQNKIGYGLVKNQSGQFIKASMDTVSEAAAGVKMPDDFRVSITDARQERVSHLELHLDAHSGQYSGCQQVQGNPRLPGWMLTEGQKVAPT
jgi:phosphate transport system substrate-binding protein